MQQYGLTSPLRVGVIAFFALTSHPVIAQENSYSVLLNTSYSGPVSFFLLAEDRGYFDQAGLDLEFVPGPGAAAMVPEVVHGKYDIGYGDMTALIERIARSEPNTGPVAIFTTFNSVPFTIAVDADGPIKTPKDLEGHTLSGHPMDAALVTFDMFANATGVDASKVEVVKLEDAMGDQVAAMLEGKQADGVFGFVNTIIASVAPKGIDGKEELRFLTYAEYLPDMYGNTLFVTRELYESAPEQLPGLVQALNHGIADAIADPDAAVASVVAHNPEAIPEVNRNRLVGTLNIEMAHPEGAKIGIGDMDPERLERLIALVVESKGLPRTPSVDEVFDHSFLPPEEEKIKTLAN